MPARELAERSLLSWDAVALARRATDAAAVAAGASASVLPGSGQFVLDTALDVFGFAAVLTSFSCTSLALLEYLCAESTRLADAVVALPHEKDSSDGPTSNASTSTAEGEGMGSNTTSSTTTSTIMPMSTTVTSSLSLDDDPNPLSRVMRRAWDSLTDEQVGNHRS